jgi:hypothetical protein
MSPGLTCSWKARAASSAGSKLVDRVKAIVVIEVQQAQPLASPAYDDGSTSEVDMVKTYEARFARLLERYRDA